MIYSCECDECQRITKVDTDVVKIGPNERTYVTAYGYLTTPCIWCGKSAYTPWVAVRDTNAK